jgi:ADP-heptose:LPS heptosyltransferase
MLDKYIDLYTDCQYYEGNKPCVYHKEDRRICINCADYKKIEIKILIVKLDALGDVLRTTSILPSLHSKYPGTAITWITRRNALPLLKNNALIHKVYAVEENYIEYILNQEFDVGICLDADVLSASILSLSHCSQKFGFISDRKGSVFPVNEDADYWFRMGVNDELKSSNRKNYQDIIHDICDLRNLNSRPQLVLNQDSEAKSKIFKEKHDLIKYSQLLGINTGGGLRWQYKKWIKEYYPALINQIKKAYPELGIILFGGPEEVEFNQYIIQNTNDLIIDAGCNNTIVDFISLVNICDVFLTPDSLGMHISIALNKITIVTVGPTSPWELDIYGKGEIIYNSELSCIACYKNKCEKQINCMNTLTVDKIFSILTNFLQT